MSKKQIKDWRIENFSDYYFEGGFSPADTAYLFHEADPALDYEKPLPPHSLSHLATFVAEETAIKFYPGANTYQGSVPADTWADIVKLYTNLLKAVKNGRLPLRDGLISRDVLKSFFQESEQRPRFLFPDNRGSEQAQPTQNEDKEKPDFDNFIRGLKVVYESEREIKIQVSGQKAKCFNHEALGFRDNTTLEWKTLLDILQAPSLTYALGPAYTYSEDGASKIKSPNPEYSAARKRIGSISKKLVVFIEKQYNLKALKNYSIYEPLRAKTPTIQLKFRQKTLEQEFADPIDGGYNGYSKEAILKNLKELASDKKIPSDYLSKRIEEAKLKGITKDELENILPLSRSALLLEN